MQNTVERKTRRQSSREKKKVQHIQDVKKGLWEVKHTEAAWCQVMERHEHMQSRKAAVYIICLKAQSVIQM